jgi:8-oxo-dGTP pyrophosphatase MutT (NUDIX family)
MQQASNAAAPRARLFEELEGYAAAEPLERTHLARMLELLRAPGDPFSRVRYAPGHFTASAFVLSPARELLLIHHGKLGIWVQPGGHVDPEDTDLASAAAREAREETGIEQLELVDALPFDLDVHAIPARGDALAHEHFDVRFLFRASDIALRAGSDARAARWACGSEIDAIGTDDSVMRAVRKLRAQGLLG